MEMRFWFQRFQSKFVRSVPRSDQKPTEHICVNESVNVTVIEITECFTFQAKIG